jgi:hypothetical protein
MAGGAGNQCIDAGAGGTNGTQCSIHRSRRHHGVGIKWMPTLLRYCTRYMLHMGGGMCQQYLFVCAERRRKIFQVGVAWRSTQRSHGDTEAPWIFRVSRAWVVGKAVVVMIQMNHVGLFEFNQELL